MCVGGCLSSSVYLQTLPKKAKQFLVQFNCLNFRVFLIRYQLPYQE